MDNEFEPKSNDQQDKRQQAKSDLDELLQMLSQMDNEQTTASEPKVRKVELPSQKEEKAEHQDSEEVEEEVSGEQLAAEIMAEIAAEKKGQSEPTAEETEKPSEEQTVAQSIEQPEQPVVEQPTQPDASKDEDYEAAQRELEEILNRQTNKNHVSQPMTIIHSSETDKKSSAQHKSTQHKKATASKPAQTQPKKKRLTKKQREARRRKKRMQRMCVLGVLGLILVLILVSCVRAVWGGGDHKPSGGKEPTSSSASTAVTEEKDTRPASQQESKQYKAIKDDTSLPAYALKYPGMYSDAVDKPNKEKDEKVCYLTFDDGPSSTNTPGILDVLKEKGIKATFFVVTSTLDGNEDLLKRIVDEGHTLCIHANEHEYGKIYATTEAFLEDFATAYDKIYEVTGYRVHGFRFPGGSNNGVITSKGTYKTIIEEMTRRGFEYYDWNAYDHDAEGGNYTVQQMVDYAFDEVTESSRHDTILLMHDTYGKEKTVEALPHIIDRLQAEGIELLPIKDTTRPVHFQVDEHTPPELPEVDEEEEEDSSQTDSGKKPSKEKTSKSSKKKN